MKPTNRELALILTKAANWLERHRWLQANRVDLPMPKTRAACGRDTA